MFPFLLFMIKFRLSWKSCVVSSSAGRQNSLIPQEIPYVLDSLFSHYTLLRRITPFSPMHTNTRAHMHAGNSHTPPPHTHAGSCALTSSMVCLYLLQQACHVFFFKSSLLSCCCLVGKEDRKSCLAPEAANPKPALFLQPSSSTL